MYQILYKNIPTPTVVRQYFNVKRSDQYLGKMSKFVQIFLLLVTGRERKKLTIFRRGFAEGGRGLSPLPL